MGKKMVAPRKPIRIHITLPGQRTTCWPPPAASEDDNAAFMETANGNSIQHAAAVIGALQSHAVVANSAIRRQRAASPSTSASPPRVKRRHVVLRGGLHVEVQSRDAGNANGSTLFTSTTPTAMSTPDVHPGLRAAQVLGLSGAAFLAGKTFSQSFSTVPSFLLAPAPLLARQWKRMFDADKLLSPLIVLGSGTVFALLARREPSLSSTKGALYASSAILLFATFPYSELFLHPLYKKLEAKAAEYAGLSITDADVEMNVKREETVHYLVDRWATVNLGRSIMVTCAALLATWARCAD